MNLADDIPQGSPVISVITVVLNDAAGLSTTLASLKAQTFRDFEYIVIDGGSRDGTLDVMRQNTAFIQRSVSEPDRGIYDAMNKGIAMARGELIGILNAGDSYRPDGLQIIANYAKHHPHHQYFFGSVIKKVLRSKLQPWKIRWSFDFYSCHSVGFFIRRNAQAIVGNYNIRYRCSADYDLFYRMIVKHRMRGLSTKPSEIIGDFAPGGYSSTLDYLEHLVEETRIRLDNGQGQLQVLLIFILRYLKNVSRIGHQPKT